ncbi:unannotated protein [freshwater metagenome]|uniref:Unannotated protein n=1 Tax=freshwater metagenome TaxID=449393 RepID=A0A6J7FFS5_9ZZZZ
MLLAQDHLTDEILSGTVSQVSSQEWRSGTEEPIFPEDFSG